MTFGVVSGGFFPLWSIYDSEKKKKIIKLHAYGCAFCGPLVFLYDAETEKAELVLAAPKPGPRFVVFSTFSSFSFNNIIVSDSRGSHFYTPIV